MKELTQHTFVDESRPTIHYPEQIWSGKLLQLDMQDLQCKTTHDLGSRRQALLEMAKKKGVKLLVNRGRGADGKPDNTLIVQAILPKPEGTSTEPKPEPKPEVKAANKKGSK